MDRPEGDEGAARLSSRAALLGRALRSHVGCRLQPSSRALTASGAGVPGEEHGTPRETKSPAGPSGPRGAVPADGIRPRARVRKAGERARLSSLEISPRALGLPDQLPWVPDQLPWVPDQLPWVPAKRVAGPGRKGGSCGEVSDGSLRAGARMKAGRGRSPLEGLDLGRERVGKQSRGRMPCGVLFVTSTRTA
jgi:hypothetical protein